MCDDNERFTFSVCLLLGHTFLFSERENFMKKLAAILITVLIAASTLVLSACGNSNSTTSTTSSASQETGTDDRTYEYTQAQKAYAELNKAADLCEKAMDVIYNSWYFAIYDGDDGDVFDFAQTAGLTYGEISDVLKSRYSSTDSIDYGNFNNTIMIAKEVLTKRGTYSKAQSCIDNAKTYLKEVTDKYADYTAYPTLKRYYSEVSSYLEFAKSPSGVFAQLRTTMDNYETNIRTYKNDLSFVLE